MKNKTFPLFAVCILLQLCSVTASVYYVAKTGNDTNDGKSLATPFLTISKSLIAVNSGDTIYVRGGIYREEVNTWKTRLNIFAYNNEQPAIYGSEIVTGWIQDGLNWKISGLPVRPTQVFDDGTPLRIIGYLHPNHAIPSGTMTKIVPVGTTLSDMAPGRFFWDTVSGTLYIRLADDSDPNLSTMEVAKRQYLFRIADSSHVRGFIGKYNNACAFTEWGYGVLTDDYCTLEDCTFEWCDMNAISLGYERYGSRAVNCIVRNNGNTGFTFARCYDYQVENCTISYNNLLNFNVDWGAGGMKVTTESYGIIENCIVTNNYATGLWLDYCFDRYGVNGPKATIIRNNFVSNNKNNNGKGEGIMIEVSELALLYNNIVENSRRGIYISASWDTKVLNNVIAGSSLYGLDIAGTPRTDGKLENVYAYNNIFFENDSAQSDLHIVREDSNDRKNIVTGYNLIWRNDGSMKLWYGDDNSGGWAGTTFTNLADWQNNTPHGVGYINADPLFSGGSGSNAYKLLAGSPAINSGIIVSEVNDDYFGVQRPLGAGYDMGVHEYDSSTVIAERALANDIQIYPLPFENIFRVKFSPVNTNDIYFCITDMMEKQLYQSRNEKTFGIFEKEINMGKLPSGIYFLLVKLNNQTFVKKLVKL